MATKPKSNVTVDIKRNLLYVTLTKNPDQKVLNKIYTDVRFGVADLKPGFGVITDLSQCTIGHLNGIPILKKITTFLISNQVGQVVRVLGKKKLIFKQILRYTDLFQGYTVAYVNTREEAENKFLNSPRRNALRFYLHEQQIGYRINRQKGTAKIIDISVSGCAVQDATLPLTFGAEISLTIDLFLNQNTPKTFTLSSKVIRAQDNSFAVQFLDDERKDLYECLTYMTQR